MPRDERDIEILRRMTPERKLAVMRSLIRQAYTLKEAGIRAVHPDLPQHEVRARTIAAVAGDRSCLVRLFVAPLERAGITYMVTGGVASVVYGDPRFTRDVDLVVELDAGSVGTLMNAFDEGSFYVPPEEALLEEVERREGGHFYVIDRDTALRADVYLAGEDPFHAWALERRQRIEVEGLAIWLAPLEYVIVRKLEYFRASGSDRHLRDVAMMLRISGSLVSPGALGEWSERYEVQDLLEEARAFDHD